MAASQWLPKLEVELTVPHEVWYLLQMHAMLESFKIVMLTA